MTNLKLIFSYAFSDIRRQKVRSILGMIGVSISVALLAIVLLLSDSISLAMVDYLSIDAGNQDLVVTIRHYNGEPKNRSSYFEYNPIIETIKNNSDDIESFIPRMEVLGKVNISEDFDSPELTEFQTTAMVSGINFTLENQLGFGNFVEPGTSNYMELNNLSINECAIYYELNDNIRYAEGDIIKINMTLKHGNIKLNHTVNYTVKKIFDFNLKWPNDYRTYNLIVVNVNSLYKYFSNSTLDFSGHCNKMITTFRQNADIYDVRDIDGSEQAVLAIASKIQLALGLDEYYLTLPKLGVLGYSEMVSVIVTVIFIFVSIIAMLISGVLINGILKTSVEERIREFGIFRVLGAHKEYSLSVVLVQGFLLVNFGTIFGLLGAIFGTQYLVIPYANRVLFSGGESFLGNAQLVFSITLPSIIITYTMGISVGLFVSISPALKVRRLQIIESIHPYRHEDSLYHLQKKASVNYRLILVGLILALNGGFIYFVVPRILVSADMGLFAAVLIIVLLIFLIGLTLAGLGLMPVILRLVIMTFKPISRKLHQVIKIFVFRYQRRNSSTIIIFALSFSFAIFTATFIQSLSAILSLGAQLRYGSNLVMETTGWDDTISTSGGGFGFGFGFSATNGFIFNLPKEYSSYSQPNLRQSNDEFSIDYSKILTTQFKRELLNFEGVERVSSLIASPSHLTQIYSDSDKEFSAQLGDYAGLTSSSIRLYGIDEEYTYTIDSQYLVMTQGSIENSFYELHNSENYTCIVSEGIAVDQDLKTGDKIRIQITRGNELESYPFTIVGTASNMPGLSGFGNSPGGNGGVLVSQNTYLEILALPSPAWVEKFFINLKDNYLSRADQVVDAINDVYRIKYSYRLVNLANIIERNQSTFEIIDTLFGLILVATVFICLFGLLSSSYSTIIERKKEIGVVRTLGLKGKQMRKMFIIEALIIMLSSGTIGVIIGYLTGYLLNSTIILLSNTPYDSPFPWLNFLAIYAISIIFILIGMRFLLRKLKKQKIVDIYRETM